MSLLLWAGQVRHDICPKFWTTEFHDKNVTPQKCVICDIVHSRHSSINAFSISNLGILVRNELNKKIQYQTLIHSERRLWCFLGLNVTVWYPRRISCIQAKLGDLGAAEKLLWSGRQCWLLDIFWNMFPPRLLWLINWPGHLLPSSSAQGQCWQCCADRAFKWAFF